MSGSLVGS